MTTYRMVLKIPKNRAVVDTVILHSEYLPYPKSKQKMVVICANRGTGSPVQVSKAVAKEVVKDLTERYGDEWDYEVFECDVEDDLL